MKTLEIENSKLLRIKKLITICICVILISFLTSLSEVLSAENDKYELEDTNQINMQLIINEEPDRELELESWMTDITLFNKTDIYLNKPIEEEIEIEPWMLEFNILNYAQSMCKPDEEKELEIEEWMLNIYSFDEEDNLAQSNILK